MENLKEVSVPHYMDFIEEYCVEHFINENYSITNSYEIAIVLLDNYINDIWNQKINVKDIPFNTDLIEKLNLYIENKDLFEEDNEKSKLKRKI